jgi:uncharacterized protein (DUF305 family)
MKRFCQAVLLLLLLAFATGELPKQTLRAQDSHAHNGNAPDPVWSELIGSMENMHVAMGSVTRSGDSDVDFVRLMLPHHQAAIDMARAQLVYGKDPQMRRLAQEIVTDQQSEIELMQLWLKQHESNSRR